MDRVLKSGQLVEKKEKKNNEAPSPTNHMLKDEIEKKLILEKYLNEDRSQPRLAF